MKKLNLRLKLTVTSSVVLIIACVLLTMSVNISADNVLEMSEITKSYENYDEIPQTTLTPAKVVENEFRLNTIYAMLAVIIGGTIATYLISGKVLKPIEELTKSVEATNINNLNQKIELPHIQDEVHKLTKAFNNMTENLQKSFEVQNQFSRDVAHELRTPLAIMQAKLEVHNTQNANDDLIVSDMKAQVSRLIKLVDDLLWFSKDVPIENVYEIDASVILEDICHELSLLASNKNIKIELYLSPLIIKGNDMLLERVFYNIIENALKYSQENSAIKIEVVEEKIVIKDNANSIIDKSKIFTPFYREDSETRGSGLGLAISKKILDKHNATIKVIDNIPKGSVFEIEFNK